MFHRRNVKKGIETLITDNISHISAGDFNLHLNNVDNPDTSTSNELLECFDSTNYVNFATCASGNTLDLVISDDRDMIQCVDQGCQFSDHLAVNSELRISRPSYNKIKTSSQKINDIGTKPMANEIKSKLDGIKYNSLSEHVHLYNDMLECILEKYVPIKIKCKTCKTCKPCQSLAQQRHSHCTKENMQIGKVIPS